MAPFDARAKLEQIRRNKRQQQLKNRSSGSGGRQSTEDVRDLRQIIVKKTKRNYERSPDRTYHGRVTKLTRPNTTSGLKDTRDVHRNPRRNFSQTLDKSQTIEVRRIETRSNKVARPQTVVVTTRTAPSPTRPTSSPRTVRMGSRLVPEQQYYKPPHIQLDQPSYETSAQVAARKNNSLEVAHVEQQNANGASILISNLSPESTQSDIIEIFGNVGIMTAVNIINQTTALVKYQNSSDAVRAVKFYNNRLLDGKPMLVNMMPNNI